MYAYHFKDNIQMTAVILKVEAICQKNHINIATIKVHSFSIGLNSDTYVRCEIRTSLMRRIGLSLSHGTMSTAHVAKLTIGLLYGPARRTYPCALLLPAP